MRERLALAPGESAALLGAPWLRDAAAATGLTEIAVLSTCNRTELYASAGSEGHSLADATALFMRMLSGASELAVDALAPHVYVHAGLAAIDHLCRVAAGLDSMIVGETEILGQVGVALGQSVESSWAGPLLDAAFHTALRAGRRARAETGISRRCVGVASEAVELLRGRLGTRARPHVLVLGAGAMGRSVARVVSGGDFATLRIAGRTPDRARSLAKDVDAEFVSWAAVGDSLSTVDAVVVATSAPEPIITTRMVSRARGARRAGQAQLFIDICVPRNVEPQVGSMADVELYDLDHIQARIGGHLEGRRMEIPLVERIIAEELAHFERSRRGSAMRPVLSALRAKGEEIRRREVDEQMRALGSEDPALRAHFDALSRAVVTKLLHEPSRRLRSVADVTRARASAELVRELFDLEIADETAKSGECPA